MGGFRAAGLAAAAVTAVGVVGLATPAYADTTVTVQGTDFPDPARADLSLVGCADPYHRTDEDLAPSIGLGPGEAPSGTRSLGWDLAGGNAVGVVFPVPSVLATTTAALAVNAAVPASGVAYSGYQPPSDAGTSLVWIGRAPLTTPGGAWQQVDAVGRVYVWTQYDMTTQRQVTTDGGVSSTVADFVSTHGGDGPGFYSIGFGCDGAPFSMDALRVGSAGAVTTYDLEGLRTSVTISSQRSTQGGDVTITGRLGSDTGDAIPFATMILESRAPTSAVWRPVQVAGVRDGAAHATVEPEEPAFYRWRFVARPLAEGSVSEPLWVDVPPTQPDEPPSPTAPPPTSTSPAGTPSPSPSSTSAPPTPALPTPASPTPASPTPSATPSPSDIATSLAASVSVSASPGDPVGESPSPVSTP